MRIVIPLIALILLSACASTKEALKTEEDPLYLKPAAFSDLPGWEEDALDTVIPALQKSCEKIKAKDAAADVGAGGFAGSAAAWQEACAALPQSFVTDTAARGYFENTFTPYRLRGKKGYEGLFTGYYEPLLRGSLEKHGPYQIPLYGRPADMITVSLGDFSEELKGKSITGRVSGQSFIPYYTRAEIENGALLAAGEEKPEIVWVDDAVDAFFLHIQGSGKVEMEDGSTLRVGYAAQNGHAYTAIGKELIDRGALTKEEVSMQTIRAWLEANPDAAAEVMNINASYVFFRRLDDDIAAADGPLGAQGVSLTPLRSLAVDRKKIPYGAPVWLDAEVPESDARLRRLMVAQDTGGAIKGAVRGDVFWGAGEEATDKAGKMKSKGEAWILLPKTVAVPPDRTWRFWRGMPFFTR